MEAARRDVNAPLTGFGYRSSCWGDPHAARHHTIALIITLALGMPIASVTSRAGQAALEAAAAAGGRSRQQGDVI